MLSPIVVVHDDDIDDNVDDIVKKKCRKGYITTTRIMIRSIVGSYWGSSSSENWCVTIMIVKIIMIYQEQYKHVIINTSTIQYLFNCHRHTTYHLISAHNTCNRSISRGSVLPMNSRTAAYLYTCGIYGEVRWEVIDSWIDGCIEK